MELKQVLYEKKGKKVVEALNKKYFEAYYCNTKEEAAAKVLSLIPQNHSISWGGCLTMDELGLKKSFAEKGYTVIDRDTAKDMAEREKLMHDALNCGTFIMSSNAITEDGQLFNIDGKGNRVAALIYGPESVIVIAGMNKVVKTMEDAVSRVRNYVAPYNAQRFDVETPCKITGECANCNSQSGICAQMVTTRFCKPQGRIKVVLVGEDLGM